MGDQFKVETIQEGDGKTYAKQGQFVKVHYDGVFKDGRKFDSSRDRGQPFTFRLGVGQVIRCWDEGVAKMTKGEKALLTCPYQYAYGEQGYPGVIPPKATLKFEVEFIDVKQ